MGSRAEERISNSAVTVGNNAPAYLAKFAADDHSLDNMTEYRVLPRIKVIQAMTAMEMKKKHGEGSVILSPLDLKIAEPNEKIFFTPVFFWTEFIKWRDQNDKSGPAIVERSTDKEGPLAQLCRGEATRKEPYQVGGKDYKFRNSEHLNFGCVIEGSDSPAVLSFSRGEFFNGRNFITMASMRRLSAEQKAPLWMQRWEMSTHIRNKNGYSWFGLDCVNPSDSNPWIAEDRMEFFKSLYEELASLYKTSSLGVNREDEHEEVVVDPDL